MSDLLRMSTGNQAEAKLGPGDIWTKKFLAQPVPFKPGTHFLYNTPATYMLSAIVQKATGMTVFEYLGPRLFEPLGIEHAELGNEPAGHQPGRLRTERPDRRHRTLRPALSSERQMARKATDSGGMGGGGDCPPNVKRQQPHE